MIKKTKSLLFLSKGDIQFNQEKNDSDERYKSDCEIPFNQTNRIITIITKATHNKRERQLLMKKDMRDERLIIVESQNIYNTHHPKHCS